MTHHLQSKQSIDGFLLLDKPLGKSSNAVLQQVKRLFCARKAGHTGSLDPLASGMLPICFGEATKFSQFLLDADKTYEVTAKLGLATTTGDREGEIVEEKPVPPLNEESLLKILTPFIGEQLQIPSMYSAIKYQGKPLYTYARQGITVPRKPRPITIFTLQLKEFSTDTLTLFIHCSKGTYIRTLVEDIGISLGCGAHVISLRRLNLGGFKPNQMVSVDSLFETEKTQGSTALKTYLLPLETAVVDWPAIVLNESAAFYLQHGQAVRVEKTPKQGWLRLLDASKHFIGVGEILHDGRIAPRRLLKSAEK